MDTAINPILLRAWVAGRSQARGLPGPVLDRGGSRVDTNSDVEVCRWIFPEILPGLLELGRDVRHPGYLLKVCGPTDDLRAAVPNRWQVEPTGYFMMATACWGSPLMPAEYTMKVERIGAVTEVQIRTVGGALVGSGYAAETEEAFVYDRIMTALGHRRKGLGRALMTALQATRHNQGLPGLLVATEDGRALYRSLGWRTLSPYSTASIPAG